MVYDEKLEFYYNNNQKFLQKRLDPSIIQQSKIFEKEEIRWICVDDILNMRSEFRPYFQNIVDMIYNQRAAIKKFISRSLKKSNRNTLKKLK